MLPQEVLRQIRRLQIKARRAVADLLGGEYHSVFKGSGIAFEEVREYHVGDDVRMIDWNVTARVGQPFIKRFVEDRELTVLLAVDCSGSLEFGTRRHRKREVAAEVAALLAFSAIANRDRVGFLALTDRVECFIPPRSGARHVLRLIREVLFFEPKHRGTCLKAGLDYLNRVQRRRAIVFLLSDFLDDDFGPALKRTGRRHDLTAVRLFDPGEEEFPPVGMLEVADAETGRRRLIDTASPDWRNRQRAAAAARRESLRQLTRSAAVDLVEISTEGDHLDALIRFFRQHGQRRAR